MKGSRHLRRGVLLWAVAGLGLSVLGIGRALADPAELYFEINSKGELVRPTGYREWVFVGTPLTPNDMNGGRAPFPEFHAVYMDPASFKHWKKTGAFRDGTILMKELISVDSKLAVSGRGYFMGEYLGLEATIKSSKHFPDEPGNWAYFSFTKEGSPMMNPEAAVHGGTPKATAAKFPAAACNACHEGNAAEDWVFTQYYPVLRGAKP